MRTGTWVKRTVDVRELALSMGDERDGGVRFSLSAIADRYGVPVASPHEALDDALVTAQLFLVLATRLEERGLSSARSYLKLTRA
jgi:DNA polymerase-3 subunit epsilon